MSGALPSSLAEHRLCARIKQQDLDWFAERGVAPLTLLRDSLGGFSEVKVGRVSFNGHAFEFERHRPERRSFSAFIFLARDHRRELVDLVAWHCAFPLASWLGRATLLGEECAFAPRLQDGLPIYRTPLEWLRARRFGCVVVDPRRAAPLLCEAAPLEARDVEHGLELRRLLTVEPPRILIATSTEKIAA